MLNIYFLYTTLSRAREKIILIGSEEIITKLINFIVLKYFFDNLIYVLIFLS